MRTSDEGAVVDRPVGSLRSSFQADAVPPGRGGAAGAAVPPPRMLYGGQPAALTPRSPSISRTAEAAAAVRQSPVQGATGGRLATSAESNISQTSSARSPGAKRKWLALRWLSRSLGGGGKSNITSFDVEEVGSLRETYTPVTGRSLDAGATAGDAPVTGPEAGVTGGSTSSTSRRLMLTPGQAAVAAGNTGGSGTSSSSRRRITAAPPMGRSPGSDTAKRSNRLAAAAAAGASAAMLLGDVPRTTSTSSTAADPAIGSGLLESALLGALSTSGNLPAGGSSIRPTIQPPQDSPVRAHLLTPTTSQSTPASGQHRYSPQLTGSTADDEDSEEEVDRGVRSSSHRLRLFGRPSATAATAAGAGSSRGRSTRPGTSTTEEALAVQYAMMLDDQEPGHSQASTSTGQSQPFGQGLLRPTTMQGRASPQQQLAQSARQPQPSDTSPVQPRVLTTAGQSRLTRPILLGPAPVVVPRSPATRRDTPPSAGASLLAGTAAAATTAVPTAAGRGGGGDTTTSPGAGGEPAAGGGSTTASAAAPAGGAAPAAATSSFPINVESSEEEGGSSWGDDQVRWGQV